MDLYSKLNLLTNYPKWNHASPPCSPLTAMCTVPSRVQKAGRKPPCMGSQSAGSTVHRVYLLAELGHALQGCHTQQSQRGTTWTNYSQRSVSIVRDMVGMSIPASASQRNGRVQALRNLNKTVEKCNMARRM